MIENGFVHIPETAPWLGEYLHEITVFPNGKHDDQVDSTAQFLDWFKMPFPGQGIYEFYRGQAEALQHVLAQFRSGSGHQGATPGAAKELDRGTPPQAQPGAVIGRRAEPDAGHFVSF